MGKGKRGTGEQGNWGTGNCVCRTCRTSVDSNRNSRQFSLMRCALCNFWPTIFHCNAFWPFLYFYLISFRFRIHIHIRVSCCFPCGTSRRAVCCASAFVYACVYVFVCVACGCVSIFDFRSFPLTAATSFSVLLPLAHQQSHSQPQLRRSPSNNNALLNSQIVFHALLHSPQEQQNKKMKTTNMLTHNKKKILPTEAKPKPESEP